MSEIPHTNPEARPSRVKQVARGIAALAMAASVGAATTACESNERKDAVETTSPSSPIKDSFSGICNFIVDNDPSTLQKGEATAVAPGYVILPKGEGKGKAVIRPLYILGDKNTMYKAQPGSDGVKLQSIGKDLKVHRFPGVPDMSRQQRRQFDGCQTKPEDEARMPPGSQAVFYEGKDIRFKDEREYASFEGEVPNRVDSAEELRKWGAIGAEVTQKEIKQSFGD